MKKSLALLLVFALLLVALPAQAATKKDEWKQAYKSYILEYISSENFGQDSLIVLFDFDRDGIPELIVGEPYRTVNRVDLAFTFKNGKAQKLSQKGTGLGAESPINFTIGMEAFNTGNVKIFKNKKNRQYKTIVKDGGGGVTGWESGEYAISLQGTQLITHELSKTYYDRDEDSTEYIFKGKILSETMYNKSRQNYFSEYTQIPSQSKQLPGLKLVTSKENGTSYEKEVNIFLGIK
ncbi:hypothetical protein MHI27_12085 [Paenibacillus sp. FSL H8-0261]|uniref:hypothetical protein n=1 Tax=Paenibacillus sp. FSL H8-0261 TaxID=2921381 RepID=UPI00324B57C2